jgi:hypothetical protein
MTDNDTIWRRIDHATTITENVHDHLDDSVESSTLLKAIGILEQAKLEIEDRADEKSREGHKRDT